MTNKFRHSTNDNNTGFVAPANKTTYLHKCGWCNKQTKEKGFCSAECKSEFEYYHPRCKCGSFLSVSSYTGEGGQECDDIQPCKKCAIKFQLKEKTTKSI